MIQFAIDSSRLVSFALQKDDSSLASAEMDFGRDSDSRFLPALTRFLAEHSLVLQDVTHWTVGTGPGSFAGIRFALAMVKGFCAGAGALSRGVPSSYALATQMRQAGRVGVLTDARCGKAFLSIFQCDETGPQPVAADAILGLEEPWPDETACDCYCTCGESFAALLPASIQGRLTLLSTPDATPLLLAPSSLWPWLATPAAEPIYVRPPA
ncbi:MAG: tRNA (adenosine(37)-N6)-threonylcarbamoyltransferase complex dimerization subunit type 1 TsaB [Victivallales bacterium]|nr:tRNA (adenosine(37)-N6)-threonylcarbamoyltransferase complex dimerization subunit type 1 TsaB [Victivallales bacterium]